MKKVIIILVSFFILTSCSKEKFQNNFKKVETEQAYVFPTNQEYLYEYSYGYYHDVVRGDNLNNLAKKYLGDRERWGELLTKNQYISSQAEYRHKPHATLKIWKIFPGERILLPNDATNAQTMGINNSIRFLIDEATHEEYIRKIPTERNTDKLYVSNSNQTKNKEGFLDTESSGVPIWLQNFWNFIKYTFLPLLGIIILFILLFFIARWIISLFEKDSENQTSVTESQSHHCSDCHKKSCIGCDNSTRGHLKEIRKLVSETSNKKDIRVSYKNKETKFKYETFDPRYLSGKELIEIINAQNYNYSASLIYIIKNPDKYSNLPQFKTEEEFKEYIEKIIKNKNK